MNYKKQLVVRVVLEVLENNMKKTPAIKETLAVSSRKVYYSHAKNTNNTAQEKQDIETLQALGFVVDNPYHSKYQEFWETEGFEFSKVLIESNDVFAFRALSDGRISAGVAKEVAIAESIGKPVIELPYSLSERVKLNITDTVALYAGR